MAFVGAGTYPPLYVLTESHALTTGVAAVVGGMYVYSLLRLVSRPSRDAHLPPVRHSPIWKPLAAAAAAGCVLGCWMGNTSSKKRICYMCLARLLAQRGSNSALAGRSCEAVRTAMKEAQDILANCNRC